MTKHALVLLVSNSADRDYGNAEEDGTINDLNTKRGGEPRRRLSKQARHFLDSRGRRIHPVDPGGKVHRAGIFRRKRTFLEYNPQARFRNKRTPLSWAVISNMGGIAQLFDVIPLSVEKVVIGRDAVDDDDSSAALYNARHLADCRAHVGVMMWRLSHCDYVERPIRKRESLGRSLPRQDVGKSAGASILPGFRQHLLSHIVSNHLGGMRGEGQRRMPGSGRDVEDHVLRLRISEFDHPAQGAGIAVGKAATVSSRGRAKLRIHALVNFRGLLSVRGLVFCHVLLWHE